MTLRPNIVLITSDQQRGDCYGFEGRRVSTPHLDDARPRGHALLRVHHPEPRVPAFARIDPDRAPAAHARRLRQRRRPAIRQSARPDSPGRSRGRATRPAFSARRTSRPRTRSRPTGTPECSQSQARYGPDWHGPYMGFDHVELMVVGHNCSPPLEPPLGPALRALVPRGGRGDGARPAVGPALPPDPGAAQTWHSALPVGLAQLHLDRRPHDRFAAASTRTGPSASGHPFPIRTMRSTPRSRGAAPRPGRRRPAPAPRAGSRAPAVVAPRQPRGHAAASRTRRCASSARSFSRIPAQTDPQLRALTANYYGMISLIDHNVGRILLALRRPRPRGATPSSSTRRDHGDWLGDHGLILKGPMAYEGLLRVGCLVARARGAGRPGRRRSGLDARSRGDVLDYAGVGAGSRLHGRSLRPLIEGSGDARLRTQRMGPPRLAVRRRARSCARCGRGRTSSPSSSTRGRASSTISRTIRHEMDNRFDDPAARGSGRSSPT